MRTIVQLSDLHFGRTDAALVEPLLAAIASVDPHLVVVSGDLTQRAKTEEFRAAGAFLGRLPYPRIVIPGNHDVPLYRVWERFFDPLGKFRRYVNAELEPAFVDPEIAVVGINTARSLTWKGGRVNEAQIEAVRARFEAVPTTLTRIVVTHHPFDLPARPGSGALVGRADKAMAVFARCGVDLLLAGHFHDTQAAVSVARYPLDNFSALVVQAGTATSTRGRGEANSFNVIQVQKNAIDVEPWAWTAARGQFVPTVPLRFRRVGSRWLQTSRGD